MQSALYCGTLRHRRFAPRPHAFTYGLYMTWLDLAELDTAFAGRWCWSTRRPALSWLRRADYIGDASNPLDEAVRRRVAEATGRRPSGPIRLLTHLRTFGHCFNPVSFYYCHDRDGALETIVAEITNTPWKERHAYVLPVDTGESTNAGVRFRFAKNFHVSPFMPMHMAYDWRFSIPGERLAVHMINRQGETPLFDATLDLRRREIGRRTLAVALAAYPLMTVKVVAAIYWNALRLWIKGTPFHGHPETRT